MSTNIQLGSLTKLATEDQWTLWLEDLTNVIYLNGLDEYYNSTVVQPGDGTIDKEKAEFTRKHKVVRVLIYSALSIDICEKMKHHGYNRSIHRCKGV